MEQGEKVDMFPEFIETSIFSSAVDRLLSMEEYRRLQLFLSRHPDAGKVIPGSGGLRKVRWRGGGKGKRGGVRIIYYWDRANNVIYLLLIYAKSERDDLTPKQLKMLRQILEEE